MMDARLRARHQLLRHRRRLRRRPQRDRAIGTWLARRARPCATSCSSARRCSTRSATGPNDRGLSRRAHPAPGRREPRAARRRAARPVPDPRARSRDAARGDARGARRPGPRGQGALRRREQHRGLAARARALDQRHARATRGSSGCRTRTACSTAPPEPEVLPLCADTGVGFIALHPARRRLAHGQVPARRGCPAGSRMTLRPEPYEHLQRDPCSTRSTAWQRWPASAASPWRRLRSPGCWPRRSSTRSSSARAGRSTSSRRRRRSSSRSATPTSTSSRRSSALAGAGA